MKYIYWDAPAGLSGDMILGSLLDLGLPVSLFREKMASLKLPVDIRVKETRRASLRSLKVEVRVKSKQSGERKWADVEKLIGNSHLSAAVKTQSLAIFKKLFAAEARVHGHSFRQAHLHEAGADDALVDIVGTCFLAETLEVSDFYCSPLNIGQGWVRTSHGHLPVPPPAVAELLKGIPVYSHMVKEELVTPTGAAIVSTLARKFIPFPEISYEKVGCGAGERDFPDYPNILRAFYGKKEEFKPEKEITTIEANIDDSTPQLLGAFIEKALAMGALDVFATPVMMKKNRLATKLTVLAGIDKMESLIEAVFLETSSIGIRYYPVKRRVLERKLEKVRVLGGEVAVKVAWLEGKPVNIQPEFSDCLKLAKKSRLAVKDVISAALKEFYEEHKHKQK